MEIAEQILDIISMAGVAAFAISGAMAAIESRLDMTGVVLLGVVTSVGGGLLRDILLGRLPPPLFTDPLYLIYVSVAASVSLLLFLVYYFFQSRVLARKALLLQITNVVDAVGLGAFTVVGVQTALGLPGGNPFSAVFTGVVTGVGGGILRDLLTGQIPVVLRRRIYIVASIFGAALYYGMSRAALPPMVSSGITVTAVTVIRLLATRFHWNLPTIAVPSARLAGESDPLSQNC